MTVGQSDTSPTVKWFEEYPSHSPSSLLGEGPSSLKDQSLSESDEGPERESWMVIVLEQWGLWGLIILGIAGLFWAEILVLCSWSY